MEEVMYAIIIFKKITLFSKNHLAKLYKLKKKNMFRTRIINSNFSESENYTFTFFKLAFKFSPYLAYDFSIH